jgi:antitoxin VapB
MDKADIFFDGASQSVRLPEDCRFDTDDVIINKIGDLVLLFPRDKAWDIFRESLKEFSEDFMADRDQPRYPL